MDGTFEVDIDALRSSIRTVEHMLMRFTPVPERLLLDFRTNDQQGPGIALLPQVSSFTERLKTIEQARPGFPRPERIYVVTWPLRIASLDRLGVVAAVRERLAELNAFDAIPRLDETYERLLTLEREEIRRAISGDGFHNIWPAEESRRT